MVLLAVIATLGRFFLLAKPLPEYQEHLLAHASKRIPQAAVLLQKGYATRHECRQMLIAVARVRHHL